MHKLTNMTKRLITRPLTLASLDLSPRAAGLSGENQT